MTDCCDVFLSYSRNDREAAANLRAQLRQGGLSVFKDDDSIGGGDLWLDQLQAAIAACGSFVVLVGRDGVGRWIGAETQAALNRYFGPHEDAERLPIFPVLLSETGSETLPAFLRLFQVTPWNGTDQLPRQLLEHIRERTIVGTTAAVFEGCPFVGLAAYHIDQAHLFFGRQKETLDALACFDTRRGSPTVRWLEINGNSGSGKSSLMNAGLLPLIDKGWPWARTGFAHWYRIRPMMPSEHPVGMLAESLAHAFKAEMADIRPRLSADERGLSEWLRSRKQDETAFLLAIDQFEELFTFANPEERRQFDSLLATALEDPDCPLFVISTMRTDFLDCFEDLPRLIAARNRLARPWTLGPIGEDGLREVIEGPARLAGLDVSEIKEGMVTEALDEPGVLPLVENALHWLWEKRTDNSLSGQLFTDHGGLAGILSGSADGLLAELDKRQQGRALELLFRLVHVDPEARRHTRRRISLAEAVDVAGSGQPGRVLVDRLAGQRRRDGGTAEGPLRLITVTEEAGKDKTPQGEGRWVNLIHETLIRSKGPDAAGKPQPYWPTLWSYIEQHKDRAARRERLHLMALAWKERKGLARLFGLAGWSALFGFRGIAAPGSIEQHYLRWSRASALVQVMLVMAPVVLTLIVSGLLLIYGALQLAEKLGIYEIWVASPQLEPIPAGSFMMGSNIIEKKGDEEEQPVHPVTFSQSFDIGRSEVTFDEWDACYSAGGCKFVPVDEGWGRSGRWGSRPVIYVSWKDAQEYVAWLSRKTGRTCRLPSEAEWEYAARAGTKTKYALPAPDGSDDIKGKGLANCFNCGSEWDGAQTAPVASFPANAWGVHDMHGNVFEWVEDCEHDSYAGAPQDGQAWLEGEGGDCSARVLRSGSFNVDQANLRSTKRGAVPLDLRLAFIGFRVVCSSLFSGHFPTPLTDRVVDKAQLITDADKQVITGLISAYEGRTTNQIVVVTTNSLLGMPMEDFSRELANYWHIGHDHKNSNSGILLILAPVEQLVQIEVSNGLTDLLTDEKRQHIFDEVLLPSFHSNQFSSGIINGVKSILAAVDGDQTLQTVVVRVLPNSQAAQIGLQSADIIDSYDGARFVQLSSLVAAIRRPGDSPRELIILRDGQLLQFKVAPGPLGVEVQGR